MDRLCVHQKSPKQAKAKKKPIKVVYISNPMKVTTSAAKFRSLVQELTGQDSVIADVDFSKFPPTDSADSSLVAPTPGSRDACDPGTVRRSHGPDQSLATTPFEVFEEVFTPQMLENFSGFMPTSLCCEPHLGGNFWSVEEV